MIITSLKKRNLLNCFFTLDERKNDTKSHAVEVTTAQVRIAATHTQRTTSTTGYHSTQNGNYEKEPIQRMHSKYFTNQHANKIVETLVEGKRL